MQRPVVKLKLNINQFNEDLFENCIFKCRNNGVEFESMATLGDGNVQRRVLYDLNKACSADIPGRGEFFSYQAFCEKRYRHGYDPRGVFVALSDGNWIGLSANSNWQQRNFIFNEMTGVLKQNRQQGIALALKLLGIAYAKELGIEFAYTIHDAENVGTSF